MVVADATGGEDGARISPKGGQGEEEAEEQLCRICRLPAEAERPLRSPCACRGSIRFVHDECQLRWIAARGKPLCEVCNRGITTRLLYAADAPARLPVSEFMVGASDKLTGLLLLLVFAVCVVPEFSVHLAALWAWRLALARSFAQACCLLSLRLSTASALALFALCIAFACRFAPFAVAPFAQWVARLETRRQGFRGFDGLQVLALLAVEAFLMVVIFDMALACILIFIPFSLGRIIHWCISCSSFSSVGEVNSYTSTGSALLIGYGLIISVGVTFPGLNTLWQYFRGERLMIAIFIRRLHARFLRETAGFTTLASILLSAFIMYPLFFGWLLDIFTSKMFGATMSQRLELLFAPSFASASHHCFIGHIFLNLRLWLSVTLHKILRLGVACPCCHIHRNHIQEPFHKFYFKRALLYDVIFMAVVIFAPVQIAGQLAPELFPLDITCAAEGLSLWQAPRNYANSISRVFIVWFLIKGTSTVTYLESLVKKSIAIPFLNGLLVDLFLISPIVGPADDVSLSYIWALGFLFMRIWLKLVQQIRARPVLAYSIDERWVPMIVRWKADCLSWEISMCWFLQEIFMPIATRLLAALGVPYVLAKVVFPRFGYSAAVNSAVYRFAWLGSLGSCELCYLFKVLCVKLHDSIRDERYVIGKRLEDVPDDR
ncbi:probable E3 ubiquitin ligase SUD1 [Triticum dicoccoides]|uniref:probable E3 ubiquitin ligase SUD1 n=1 Tax=Triticum dicoccoides TaxID=85692 RepID=UPI00188F8DAE|nr:probable E3 ubiquitin ligase SUD1 [Triticum dicoccoides]